MPNPLIQSLLAASIAVAAVPAHAEFLKFYSGDVPSLGFDDVATLLPTNGTSSGGDRYSTENGYLQYDLSGFDLGTLRAYGTNTSTPDGTADDRVVQDLSPQFGGLGVDNTDPGSYQSVCTSYRSGVCRSWETQWVANGTDPSDDAIGRREELRLSFSAPVTLNALLFADEDHTLDFGDGHAFDLWVDGVKVINDGQLAFYVGGLQYTGSQFLIRARNDVIADDEGFYLAGLKVVRVPAPGALALLGIGAVALGAATRRRRG